MGWDAPQRQAALYRTDARFDGISHNRVDG